MTFELRSPAGPGTLASDMGNHGVKVLATATIFWCVEDVALRLVMPHPPAGQATVGSWVPLRHLAAAPAGMEVRARATLRPVDARRLRFAVERFDAHEKIAKAERERVLVDLQRFMNREAQKQSQAPGPVSNAGERKGRGR